MSRLQQYKKASRLQDRFNAIAASAQAVTLSTTAVSSVGSLESIAEDQIGEIAHSSTEVQDSLVNALRDEGMSDDVLAGSEELTEEKVRQEYSAGLEAASLIAMASGNLAAYAGTRSEPSAKLPMFAHATGSMESFGRQEIDKFVNESINYNLSAPRQDALGEMLFPTVVMTPDQAYFKATVRRLMVYTGPIHTMDGDVTKFKKRHVLDAYRDVSVFEFSGTELIPSVKTGSVNNEDKFADPSLIPTVTRVIEGVEVETAPLAPNVEMSILGVSQVPGLISAEVYDHTDEVDHNAGLKNLYFSVTDGTDTEVIKMNVLNLTTSRYVPTAEGHQLQTRANFRTQSYRLTDKVTQHDGSASVLLKPVVDNGYTLTMNLGVDADLHLETGSFIYQGRGAIDKCYDADGDSIAVPAALKSLKWELIGLDNDLRRTNSNRASYGQLLDSDVWEEIYQVGLLEPLTVHQPTSPYNAVDVVRDLVEATHLKMNLSAITTLLEYDEQLRSFYAANVDLLKSGSSIDNDGIVGIARKVITPFYELAEVDLEEVVNSITSSDKLSDIRGYFVARMTEMAYRALQKTNYVPVLRALTGDQNATPQLLVATDQILPQFMQIEGDDRTVGTSLKMQVESSSDERMFGKIFMTFGVEGTGFRPLHFGNMIYIPELVSSIDLTRSKGAINETMVQPRFRHIPNLPVLMRINVKNLKEMVNSRTDINFKQIP